MQFEFATTPRILFGAGKLTQMRAIAKHTGGRVLVVTGKNPQRAEPLLAILREQNIGSITFSVPGEPSIETVRNGMALARRESCTWVIGFGGGSAIDTGKAISAMLTNEGDVLDYVEIIGRGRNLSKVPARFVAIPTTAGTGSEATRNAVLASPEHRVKVSLRSPAMLPRVAVVDPELTYGLPPAVTASTGLDALAQLIEAYVCLRANPMTDGLCVDGIRRAARSLRRAVERGDDANAREDMALASLFSGIALANSGLGAVHGLAAPIGGMFSAPHGEICAALLPHVMETNVRSLREREPRSFVLDRYHYVAWLLTGKSHATAKTGLEWIQQLARDLNVPRLGTFGIKQEHFGEIVEQARNASSMKPNPIALTPDELTCILESAL